MNKKLIGLGVLAVGGYYLLQKQRNQNQESGSSTTGITKEVIIEPNLNIPIDPMQQEFMNYLRKKTEIMEFQLKKQQEIWNRKLAKQQEIWNKELMRQQEILNRVAMELNILERLKRKKEELEEDIEELKEERRELKKSRRTRRAKRTRRRSKDLPKRVRKEIEKTIGIKGSYQVWEPTEENTKKLKKLIKEDPIVRDTGYSTKYGYVFKTTEDVFKDIKKYHSAEYYFMKYLE